MNDRDSDLPARTALRRRRAGATAPPAARARRGRPGQRAGPHHGGRGRRHRRRRRRAQRPGGLRARAVAADARPRPGPDPAPGRRPDPRARRRAGRHREPRRRQAGHPVPGRRRRDRRPAVRVLRRRSPRAWRAPPGRRRSPRSPTRSREPVGVVAAITPFNFPLILSSTKIAAALAAGNVVVHKPADDTPLSALFMAQLLSDAGVPDGVLNVVTGSGQVVGEALLRHPGVDKIAFTGSTAIGRHAASVAGEHLKPVTMELGGNAAHIVFDDADLDVAIGAVDQGVRLQLRPVLHGRPAAARGPPPARHRRSASSSRPCPTVPIGNPRDEATVIGPMAGERQLRKVEEYVELARKEGGRIVCGGERLDLDGGFYYKPTVIADLPADSRVIAEEVFGPVLTVQPFDTEDEAVALANGTPYGLAAGLQTRDVARAHRVAARLDAGIVWVNDWAMLDPAVPFGGVKDSGFGREYGPEALEAYTRVKSVVVSLPQPEQPPQPRSTHDHHHRGRRRRVRRRPLHPGRGRARRAPRRRGPGPDDRRRPVPHRPRRRLGRPAVPAARRARPRGRRRRRAGRLRRHVGRARRPRRCCRSPRAAAARNCRGGHPAYCATWLPRQPDRRRPPATGRPPSPATASRSAATSSASRRSPGMAVADERSVVKVDPSAPLETIAPLGCGVQTGVGAVWNVLKPGPGSTVVVAGAGAVGLSAVMAAALTPALRIVAVDVVPAPARPGPQARRHPRRRRRRPRTSPRGSPRSPAAPAPTASSRPPATCRCCARPSTASPPAAPRSSWARRRSAPRSASTSTGCSAASTVTGITLGDSETQTFIPLLAAMVADGRLPVGELVTTYDFADIEQAVADVTQRRDHQAGPHLRLTHAHPPTTSGAHHMDITGKVAVVTGAGQGLGRAYADRPRRGRRRGRRQRRRTPTTAGAVVDDDQRRGRPRRRRGRCRSAPPTAAEQLVLGALRGLRPPRRHGHQRRRAARPGAVEHERRGLRHRRPGAPARHVHLRPRGGQAVPRPRARAAG